MKYKEFLDRYVHSFSNIGLLTAAFFFAASLSPSLLPRSYFIQGMLSGLALTIGYMVGWLVVRFWNYMGLPRLSGVLTVVASVLASIIAGITIFYYLVLSRVWQNSIRDLMDMPPLESAHVWRVAISAIVIAAALVAVWRLIRRFNRYVTTGLEAKMSPRVAFTVSTVFVTILLISVANATFTRTSLNIADAIYAGLDRFVDDAMEAPVSVQASGSAQSLIEWEDIGRHGKAFVLEGPDKADIEDFLGKDTLRPLRVYVGLNARDAAEDRAELALQELLRIKAFEREVLVVITPTGEGWIDSGSVDSLEYMHGGDTAIVTMQYSYLPSWLSLIIDPDRSKVSAHILFEKIYKYWTALPHDQRPKLYLSGISLGALGSQSSSQLFEIYEDPIDGAVWSGPPFPSELWRSVMDNRNEGSPAWLPEFEDGSLFRFTARENALQIPGAEWGKMRMVYIQHASDPMSFFASDLIFTEPDWLKDARGPDVSPYLHWVPIVTFLQVAFDIPTAEMVPAGFGHHMSPASYIDAWASITDPINWSDADSLRLKRVLAPDEARFQN